MKINNTTAAEKIKAIADGKFFSVRFIKRTDGQTRDMLCHKGVSQFVKGEDRPYEPDEHNLVIVWDAGTYNTRIADWKTANSGYDEISAQEAHDTIGPQCFRSINLETIIKLRIDGKQYEVNDFPMHIFQFVWIVKKTKNERMIQARTQQEAVVTFVRELRIRNRPRGTVITDLGLVAGYREPDLESQEGELRPTSNLEKVQESPSLISKSKNLKSEKSTLVATGSDPSAEFVDTASQELDAISPAEGGDSNEPQPDS